MIVRVLHEGQYELGGEAIARLRRLDDEWMEALTADDAHRFTELRDELVALIRREGRALPQSTLQESDLIVPHADITLGEARELFTSRG